MSEWQTSVTKNCQRNKIKERPETECQGQKLALEQIKRPQEKKAKLEKEATEKNAKIEREITELPVFLK